MTIAHRLNTIQNSDKIIVFKQGQIIEEGNHEQLIQKEQGFYKDLVQGQILNVNEEEIIEQQELIEEQNSLGKELSIKNSLNLQESITQQATQKQIVKRSLRHYLGNEKYLIIPGLLVAGMNGALMPVFGLLLGRIIGILSLLDLYRKPNFQGPPYKDDIIWEDDKYVIGFFGIAIAAWLLNFLQNTIFSYIGQNFTLTLRKAYFRRLLFKDMDYFD